MDEQQEQEVIERLLVDAEEEATAKNPGFFARNFSYKHAWNRRLVLDAIAGGIVPVLLMIIDPIVFQVQDPCTGFAVTLAPFAVFAYLAVALGVPVFLAWIVFGKRLPGVIAAIFGGIFVGGVLFAAGLGVAMAPLTIPALFFLIGVLGLIPFWVAYLYLRHAIFAYKQARAKGVRLVVLVLLMVIGCVGVLALPAIAQVQVTRIVEESIDAVVADPSPDTIAASAARLTALNAICPRICVEMEEDYVWKAYYRDQTRSEGLTRLYEGVTGQRISLFDCSTV